MIKTLNLVPRNFVNGGKVYHEHINIPKRYLEPGDTDRVFARVAENEIVIPVKFAKRVEKYLKKENIKLPGL